MRRPPASEDEILVIRPEPTRPTSPSTSRGGAGGSSSRRISRGRTAPIVPPKRGEAAPARPLAGGVGQGLASQHLSRTVDVGPLTTPQAPLVTEMTAPAAATATPTPAPAFPDLRAAVRSPARLREAFLLAELFGPPLALRRAR